MSLAMPMPLHMQMGPPMQPLLMPSEEEEEEQFIEDLRQEDDSRGEENVT